MAFLTFSSCCFHIVYFLPSLFCPEKQQQISILPDTNEKVLQVKYLSYVLNLVLLTSFTQKCFSKLILCKLKLKIEKQLPPLLHVVFASDFLRNMKLWLVPIKKQLKWHF